MNRELYWKWEARFKRFNDFLVVSINPEDFKKIFPYKWDKLESQVVGIVVDKRVQLCQNKEVPRGKFIIRDEYCVKDIW